MDDLSANQFSALVRVLSFLSSTRDFKHLLSPSNLQAAFTEPQDFVIPTMPHFHFEGLGNARAKECVLNQILTYIAAGTETCELEQEEDMVVGNDYPIPPHPPPPLVLIHLCMGILRLSLGRVKFLRQPPNRRVHPTLLLYPYWFSL